MTARRKKIRSSHEQARSAGTKLAAAVADRIIGDISRLGWPEGAVLGSEPKLLERYGVSRAVFREAVRLLEHQHVARMRRGPGGGLIVQAPTLDSVIDPVAVYLCFVDARVDQVAEARLALEETVAELAPSRLTEDDIHALRDLAARERAGTVADPRELHRMLAAITRNPALEVFVTLLSRMAYPHLADISRVRRSTLAVSARAHESIVEAVLSGNEGLTRHRMRVHLQAEAEYLRRRLRSGQRLDATVLSSLDSEAKLGERVAREIFVEVTGAGWPVGRLLGSEADLMARHGVSRAVLREAVRLLEHHHIAVMRRGPGGGLFVAEPGVESATGSLALLLEHRGIRPADLLELRVAVELTTLELAVERLDDERAARLRRALEAEQDAPMEDYGHVGHDLHGVLAGIVDNPVLELLVLVLIRLTRMHQEPGGQATSAMSDSTQRAHRAIVEAVLARDVELARYRMRRHLGALASWVH